MNHKMGLQPHPFEKMKNGEKIIEVRLNDVKRQQIKLGDTIEFGLEPDRTEIIKTEVIALLNYKALDDLLLDFRSTLMGRPTAEELKENFYKYYSHEEVTRLTILAIKVKLIET